MAPPELNPIRLGVFEDNKRAPIHRWYHFVEGYSLELVKRALSEAEPEATVLDPFAGSGTTLVSSTQLGYESYFCEANPFMEWVSRVKTNLTRAVAGNRSLIAELQHFTDHAERGEFMLVRQNHAIQAINAKRNYYPEHNLIQALAALEAVTALSPEVRDHARLAVAASLVPSSNMIRRTDLRRRTPRDRQPIEFLPAFVAKLREILADLETPVPGLINSATFLSNDARSFQSVKRIDHFVTSPPYLNGTNYGRNTKLELLTLGFFTRESDLHGLRRREITAGINNVLAGHANPMPAPAVSIVDALREVAYDRRIPAMVGAYFSDMQKVLSTMSANASTGGLLMMDIGDSRYSGITIPVPAILVEMAGGVGWELKSTEHLRARRSFDGTKLQQVILNFVKH